jgi:hypothetical protein
MFRLDGYYYCDRCFGRIALGPPELVHVPEFRTTHWCAHCFRWLILQTMLVRPNNTPIRRSIRQLRRKFRRFIRHMRR